MFLCPRWCTFASSAVSTLARSNRMHFATFEHFVFLFFSKIGCCFWKTFWENTQTQKHCPYRARRWTSFSRVVCFFCPRFSRKTCGWCRFLHRSSPYLLYFLRVVVLSASSSFVGGAVPSSFGWWCPCSFCSFLFFSFFFLKKLKYNEKHFLNFTEMNCISVNFSLVLQSSFFVVLLSPLSPFGRCCRPVRTSLVWCCLPLLIGAAFASLFLGGAASMM